MANTCLRSLCLRSELKNVELGLTCSVYREQPTTSTLQAQMDPISVPYTDTVTRMHASMHSRRHTTDHNDNPFTLLVPLVRFYQNTPSFDITKEKR